MGLRRWWRRIRHGLEDRAWPRVVGLILAVCAAGLGAWFLTELGPRPVDAETTAGALGDAPELGEQRRMVTALVERFDAAELRGRVSAEDLAGLAEAVRLQERVMRDTRLRRGPEEELWNTLRRRHDEHAAAELAAETRQLEAEARAALARGEHDEGLIRLRQASERQDRLNRLYPAAPQADSGRVLRLRGEVRELQVRPIHDRSVELERAAQALIADSQWDEAAERVREALALQQDIIENHRQSIWADFARADRLERMLVGTRSGRLHVAVGEKVAEAEQAEREEAWVRAASHYLEARTLQRQLNEQYRDSPFVSTERVDALEVMRQTALSMEAARKIADGRSAMEAALRAGMAGEAGRHAAEIVREMERMRDAQPRSRHVDPDLLLKARFLDLLGPDLGRVQQRVRDSLVALPEGGGAEILGTEVSQWLFERLMGTNPSRQAGEDLPVESVTWAETQEFCRRLSWVLVRPVRLPTEAEWRRALGNLRYAPLDAWTWNAGNSGGAPRPVGTREPHPTGIRDLLGNVAEWLEAAPADTDAPEAGGSVMDLPEALIDAPVRRRSKTERSRFTGFRVVVDPA